MVLVDWQIRERLNLMKGDLQIEPINQEKQIGPASVDLRIGRDSIFFKTQYISYEEGGIRKSGSLWRNLHGEWREEDITRKSPDDNHIIEPKQFGLFHTIEFVSIPPTLVGQIEGRSSVGRNGLFIHNAGFIDPGFCGQITLELFNATDHSIIIPIGMRICQLYLMECSMPDVPYDRRKSSKYDEQSGVTLPRLFTEKEEIIDASLCYVSV